MQGMEKNNAVVELVNRLIYYPVVQFITFAPTTWYQYAYSYSDSDDDSPADDYNNPSPYNQASYVINCIFLYSAGIGFFIVFLRVQPNAYNFLISSLKRLFCCTQDPSTTEDDVTIPGVRDSNEGYNLSRLSDMELSVMIMEMRADKSESVVTVVSEIHMNSKSDLNKP